MIRLKLYIIGKNVRELVSFSMPNVTMSIWVIPGDANLLYLVKVVSARFLHYKIIVFPSVIIKFILRRASFKLCKYPISA